MEVILTKLRSNHDNLPSDRYAGTIEEKPQIGKQFVLDAGVEQVVTTPIQTVRYTGENVLEFDTRNSTYQVEFVLRLDENEKMYITPLESSILSVFSAEGIHSSFNIVLGLKQLQDKLMGKRRA